VQEKAEGGGFEDASGEASPEKDVGVQANKLRGYLVLESKPATR